MINIRDYIRESNLIEDVHDPQEIEQSVKAWEFLKDHQKLDLSVVLETHRLILKNLKPNLAGRLRTFNVMVGHYVAPYHAQVPDMLNYWLIDMEHALSPEFRNMREFSTVSMHIEFEKIHPFGDGNGRVGRMLMWWHETRLGLKPTLIEFDKRWNYYDWF